MLERIRGRSLTELRFRLRQATSARLERFGVGAAARLPHDAAFLRALGFGPGEKEAVWSRFASRDPGEIFPALRDPRATMERVRRRWPERTEELLARAARLHQGQFDLLGLEGLEFGTPVDWHLDPLSGGRCPAEHWSSIDPLDVDLVGDHKVVWELNRHQYFQILARAWLLTGEARHRRLLLDHLSSWMAENPPKRGINWTSSLELGYRSISWLWALHLLRVGGLPDPPFLLRVLKYLWVQGRHVESNLSRYFSPNTHLTGEALSLLYLGTLLPELPDAARWRRLGWRILFDQMERQILPDGTYFERASHYHRYTVDIYTHALLLGPAAGVAESELATMEETLDRLLDHLMFLTRPDGSTPLIGDDDGGHLWFPEPDRQSDVRPSLATGAALLSRSDLAYVAGGAHEETLWLLGEEGLRTLEGLESSPPARLSAEFEEGGYYIMRDGWSRDASVMVVDAGALGVMNCGHAHADALAFDLTVRGRPVLVDPGTFSYADAAARNQFRSGAAHNTVTLAGEGSSVPGAAFQWRYRGDARRERWLTGSPFDYLSGSHHGFERFAPPGRHRREVLHARGAWWIVRDRLELLGAGPAEIRFQLAAGLVASPEAGGLLVSESAGRSLLEIRTLAGGGGVMQGRLEEGWVSTAYGAREPAPRWVVPADPFPDAAVTLLLPPSARLVGATAEDTRLWLRLNFQEGTEDLVLANNGELAGNGAWETDAEWLWVRDEGGGRLEVLALGVSRLAYDGRPLLEGESRLERFEALVERDGSGHVTREEPRARDEALGSRIL